MYYAWPMLTPRSVLLLAGLGGALGVAAGCVVLNPNHCAYSKTPCADGFECSMCAVGNDGCVAAGSITDENCLFVPGTSGPGPTTDTTTVDPPTTDPDVTTEGTTPPFPTSTSGDPTSESTTELTVTTTLTTDTGETTVGPECDEAEGVANNPKCGGTTPYCLVDTCVSCESVDCEDIDLDKPTCEPISGVCVQCLENKDCKDTSAPICDTESAICGPCTMHEQCLGMNNSGTACNLETGECFPAEHVLHVKNSPGCENSNPGTDPNMPICDLQEALAKLDVGTPTTVKVYVGGMTQDQPAAMKPGNYIAAIVPGTPQVPTLLNLTTEPSIEAQAGNTLFVYQITIRNNNTKITNPAVRCKDAILWLDRMAIYDVKSPLVADDCRVHLRRVLVTNNGSGIDVSGTDKVKSTIWVENSFITNNGAMTTVGGIRLNGQTHADLRYTTIALNPIVAPALDCVGVGASADVRNSVLVAPVGADALDLGCMPLTNEFNVTRNGNTQNDVDDLFSSFAGGVFDALEGGDLDCAAVWMPGDPVADYDSPMVRPACPDNLDFIGADVP
jgi:hypothetical protein